jgi:drug/metabolite transporter (DMT)-like permease
MIVMRAVSRNENSLVLVFSMNIFYVAVLAGFVLPFWQPMDMGEIALVILTGLLGIAAQYAIVEAARLVPASVLGTVEYTALCWSFVFGFLFYAEVPAPFVYVGAGMVVAAGLILAYSERRRRPPPIETP